MTLSTALSYLKITKLRSTVLAPEKEAIQKAIDVIEAAIDVEEWDEEEKYDVPMCIHCSGNGCASCKGIGDDY
jgi:hypothetical protein